MHCKRPHKKCRPATRKKKKSAFRHDTKSASPRGIRAANLVICQKTGKHSRQVTADWQIPAWGWKGNKSPALQVFLLCFRKLIPQWYEVMGVQGSPKHHEEKDGRQGRGVEYTSVFSSIPWVHSLVTTSLRIQSGMEEHSVKILLWSPYRPRTLLPRRVGCSWGFCIPDNWH